MPQLPENVESAGQEIVPIERRDGLPVISAEDYRRFYDTDIRALGQGSATFDFQGFVKEAREGGESGMSYRDVFATNGLLKAEGHEGIHVGTDGIIDYSAAMRRLTSPEEVGEYDIYISIPAALQEEMRCVCAYDSCYSPEDFQESFAVRPGEIEKLRGSESWMVTRLSLDPKEDPLAREKVKFIHTAVVRHIEERRPLEEIQNLIYALQDELEDITEEDLAVRQLRGDV